MLPPVSARRFVVPPFACLLLYCRLRPEGSFVPFSDASPEKSYIAGLADVAGLLVSLIDST